MSIENSKESRLQQVVVDGSRMGDVLTNKGCRRRIKKLEIEVEVMGERRILVIN